MKSRPLPHYVACALSLIVAVAAGRAARLDTDRIDQKPVLVNCHVGSRGAIAAAELARVGFKSVFNLEGGVDAWEKAGNHPETTGAR